MTLNVRNKMLSAYKDIMNMPVYRDKRKRKIVKKII